MDATAKRAASKSRENSTDKVLGTLSASEIRDFLMECANLPDLLLVKTDPSRSTPYAVWSYDSSRFDRWLRKWRGLLTFQREGEDGKWRAVEFPREQLEQLVPKVRLALRRIWTEQDARQRDWYFYRLRDEYHRMVVRAENPDLIFDITNRDAVKRLLQLERTSHDRKDNPIQRARFFETWTGADMLEYVPRMCPFEAAVYWLQINHTSMLHCAGPLCAAPYFFRGPKAKRQTFCSPECADPARREAKLRWWNQSPNSPKNQAKNKSTKKTLR